MSKRRQNRHTQQDATSETAVVEQTLDPAKQGESPEICIPEESTVESATTIPNTEITPEIERAARDFARRVQEAFTREFSFLTVGRTGVGKSSTINRLVGKPLAPTNEFEPETRTVEAYKLPISNVNFVAYDTPGLCDALEEKGNDEQYITLMKEKVKAVDCMLYVTKLDDERFRSDEINAVDLVTKAFGSNIWKNSVVVFAFADRIAGEHVQRKLAGRMRLFRRIVAERGVPIDIVDCIPAVATTNVSLATPDGVHWVEELYTTVVERVSRDGYVQYLMATAPEIIKPEPTWSGGSWSGGYSGGSGGRLNLSSGQKSRIEKRTTDDFVPPATTSSIFMTAVGKALTQVRSVVQSAWGAVKQFFYGA